METNYLTRNPEKPNYPQRVSKPRYTCETVLQTDVLPLVRAQEWRDKLVAIGEHHKDAWYIKYVFSSTDAASAVLRVPAVIAQTNRSRVLRRAKISGARMCNIQQWHGKRCKYLTNIVCSCTFDALVFANLLNSFDYFDSSFTLTFKPLNVVGRNRKQAIKYKIDDYIEKFYRRSKFARNMVALHRCEDDDFLGSFSIEVTTVKPIFDVALIACDIFKDDIEAVTFGDGSMFEMSRYPNIDVDDYVTRPIDKIKADFCFRPFRGFGLYADNREILKLL